MLTLCFTAKNKIKIETVFWWNNDHCAY